MRATQFHEFAEMIIRWTRTCDTATVPPLLIQPVAAGDVATTLAQVATDFPCERLLELAGPEPHDLVDMARRTLAARNEPIRLTPRWGAGFTAEMAGDVLLPGPNALIAPTTFGAWLAAQAASPQRRQLAAGTA